MNVGVGVGVRYGNDQIGKPVLKCFFNFPFSL